MDIIRNGLDPDLYPNIDWRDLMLKKGAPSYYANINFSGGSDNVDILFLVSIQKRMGVIEPLVRRINIILMLHTNVLTTVLM